MCGGVLPSAARRRICHRLRSRPRARATSAVGTRMARALALTARVGELRRRPWGAHPQGEPTMR